MPRVATLKEQKHRQVVHPLKIMYSPSHSSENNNNRDDNMILQVISNIYIQFTYFTQSVEFKNSQWRTSMQNLLTLISMVLSLSCPQGIQGSTHSSVIISLCERIIINISTTDTFYHTPVSERKQLASQENCLGIPRLWLITSVPASYDDGSYYKL